MGKNINAAICARWFDLCIRTRDPHLAPLSSRSLPPLVVSRPHVITYVHISRARNVRNIASSYPVFGVVDDYDEEHTSLRSRGSTEPARSASKMRSFDASAMWSSADGALIYSKTPFENFTASIN